jgi:hypothetical protein
MRGSWFGMIFVRRPKIVRTFDSRSVDASPPLLESSTTASPCFAREGQEFGCAKEQVIVIGEERILCGLRMQTNDPRRKGRETRASLAFRRLLP